MDNRLWKVKYFIISRISFYCSWLNRGLTVTTSLSSMKEVFRWEQVTVGLKGNLYVTLNMPLLLITFWSQLRAIFRVSLQQRPKYPDKLVGEWITLYLHAQKFIAIDWSSFNKCWEQAHLTDAWGSAGDLIWAHHTSLLLFIGWYCVFCSALPLPLSPLAAHTIEECAVCKQILVCGSEN